MKKSPMRLKDREVLVSKIARGVEADNLKVVTKAIEKNRDYKTARVYHLDVLRLKDKERELIRQIQEKQQKIRDLVERVNRKLPIKQNDKYQGFELGLKYCCNHYDQFQGLSIVSEIGWQLKNTIMEEVSLATMDSYCQEDIHGIIEKLTEQFSGGK